MAAPLSRFVDMHRGEYVTLNRGTCPCGFGDGPGLGEIAHVAITIALSQLISVLDTMIINNYLQFKGLQLRKAFSSNI
jgi:hypothetical protein